MKRFKKFVRIVLLSINAGLVLLLLLSYVGGGMNPSSRFGFMLYFLTLAYPIIAILNIFTIFFWIYRKRWFFVISLAALLMGYPTFKNTFPIIFSKKELAPPGTVKILTYNVGGFYHGSDYNETSKGIFDFIKKQHADIVCLQELNLVNNRVYHFSETEMFNLMKEYPYKAMNYKSVSKNGHRSGEVIFSKYPIISKGTVKVGDDIWLSILFADIEIEGVRTRLYTTHLSANRLKNLDSDFYNEMTNKDQEALKGEVKYLAKTLGYAAGKRGSQVDVLSEKIAESPYPVIVAGDFNDTPATYIYKKLRKGLVDSKVQNQSGLGATYNGKYPSFRIDYILHDPCFKSYEYKKYNQSDLSDHDAISVELEVTNCKK